MKSIADFVAGKIRRAEVGDALSWSAGGPADSTLGPCEGTLSSPSGAATLHTDGMVISETRIPYASIQHVSISGGVVDIQLTDGDVRVHSTDAGALVLHATLRWIGNVRLRRKVAE